MAGSGIMAPSVGKCDQCGFTHPPVAGKCPMAKEKSAEGTLIDMNELFNPLRTIAISQIQKKEIKDTKKLFGYIIIEITKLMESYKE
jgi:hypothetical protein